MKPTSALFLSVLCFALPFYACCSCIPTDGCSTALLIYNITTGDSINNLTQRFSTNQSEILKYNNVSNVNSIEAGTNLRIPFQCNCLKNGILGHWFAYTFLVDDTLDKVANTLFQHYSRPSWIAEASGVSENAVNNGQTVQVPVNCSCGNPAINSSYGLFATYVIRQNDTEDTISSSYKVTKALLEDYNPDVFNGQNLTADEDIIFFPAEEKNGSYRAFSGKLTTRKKKSKIGLIVGLVVGGCFIFAIAVGAYLLRRKSQRRAYDTDVPLNSVKSADHEGFADPEDGVYKLTNATPATFPEFTVDKSVEFSYDELAAATDNFSISNKIGAGGYGAVYYGEIRGQRLAIKKMNMQASKEFLSELNVLTHVHHTNLVQLIGYCTVDSLFLVYEYVENGTISDYLHKPGKPTLPWTARLQIALDAARGLEYIHEHTKPAYIHRDVKSSNILIDRNFRAKVADFGLTKLTQAGKGSTSLTQPTRLVGTFGYMAPEYARFGDVSSKVDVYSFGVVLFELIAGKEAIVKLQDSTTDSSGGQEVQKSLVQMFDPVMKDPLGKEKLRTLVDPALGTDYSLESAWKLAKLAEGCTLETPEIRPTMRTVVVALMTLSSSMQDMSQSGFSENQGVGGLLSHYH